MDLKRKLLISALAAAPLLGGGTAAWIAMTPSAGAQSVPTTSASTKAETPGAAQDPAGTSAATNVQSGTQVTTQVTNGPDGTASEGSPTSTDTPGS